MKQKGKLLTSILALALILMSFGAVASAAEETGPIYKTINEMVGMLQKVQNVEVEADKYYAYCVDRDATINIGDFVREATSDDLTKLSLNSGKIAAIQQIVNNSYPAIDIEELRVAYNLPGLTTVDATNAAQAAIWDLTDPGHDYVLSGDAETLHLRYASGKFAPVYAGAIVGKETAAISYNSAIGQYVYGPFSFEGTGVVFSVSGTALVDSEGNALTEISQSAGAFYAVLDDSFSVNVAFATSSTRRFVDKINIAVKSEGDITKQQSLIMFDLTEETTYLRDNIQFAADPLTFKISFMKLNEQEAPLTGAVIGVYNNEQCTGEPIQTLTVVAEDGIVESAPLPLGTYWLKELVAPEGYQLYNGDPIVVTCTMNDLDGQMTCIVSTGLMNYPTIEEQTPPPFIPTYVIATVEEPEVPQVEEPITEEEVIEEEIPLAELPKTGSTSYAVPAALLLMAGIALLVVLSRKKAAE